MFEIFCRRVFGFSHFFICGFYYLWNLNWLREFLNDFINRFRFLVAMLVDDLYGKVLHTHLTELELFLRSWSIQHYWIVVLRNVECPVRWLITLRSSQLFYTDLLMARVTLLRQHRGWLPLWANWELVPQQVVIYTRLISLIQPPVSNLGMHTVILRCCRQQPLTRRTVF